MKPIYFPLTFISHTAAKKLSALFQNTVVLLESEEDRDESMKALEDEGMITMRSPVGLDEEKLANAFLEYKQWAEIHKGGAISFFKTQADVIPFYDGATSSQIKTDLLKKSGKKEKALPKPDHLFNARLFLRIARDFDTQNSEIDLQLESFGELEESLLKDLTDTELPEAFKGKSKGAPKDPGTYMAKERMWAWSLLLENLGEKSSIFVSDSLSAIDSMMDVSPHIKRVSKISIPNTEDKSYERFRQDFNSFLMALTEDESVENPDFPANEDPEFTATVFLGPGLDPAECFGSCPGRDKSAQKDEPTPDKMRNTVFVLIEDVF